MTIDFDRVAASYDRKIALYDISFRVEAGSLTALIGRNGAGKSTLVACLTGEKTDYRGTILLDGQAVRPLSPRQRSRLVACLPQVLPRPHVTVAELVAFGRAPYTPMLSTRSPEDAEKINWAIQATGMEALADSFVDSLSGGERKKAFFAMVLAQDTPVVVLDEPAAHLDAASRFAFLDLVDKLRRETGKTFLMVMHELPEVLRRADRIVTLHEGRLVFDGTPEECISAGIPKSCFRVEVTGGWESGYAILPLNE